MTSNARNIAIETVVMPKRQSFWVDVLKRLVREKPSGTLGLVLVVLLLFTGIFANFLAPYAMNEIHLGDRLASPSAQYTLGADHLGRDILSNIIWGARISMIIGISASVIHVLVSFAIGAISGFLGGKVDMVVQRLVDSWMSIPGFLILITVMSILGQGMWQIIAVIGIAGGIGGSRVVRSAVIGVKVNVYMDAARAIGSTDTRMLMMHILPNIMAPLIIIFTAGVGGAIMQESSLSFLGFGVPPGVPSWGSMLSAEGRQFMEMAPQLALYPGLALSLAVYGINMFGDSLRDLLDPRLRGGVGRYDKQQIVKGKR